MAGAYLPPVYQELMLNIDDFLAKIEEAKAAQDDLAAHTAESNEAMRGGGGGNRPDWYAGAGGVSRDMERAGGTKAVEEHGASIEATANRTRRLARDTEQATKHLSAMRQIVNGDIQGGLRQMANDLKSATQWMNAFGNAAGGFGKAWGSLSGIFSGPLGMLGSLVGFAKTWAVMIPTLMAAPALLAAIGGAAGGLAGSFTVLSTAVGLFALGAMKDLSYVTSVSNMAQFDALSAPLQRLYYAYHNLSNEFTIMTQTMGGNSTIIGTLTNMFNTMAVVVQRLGPLMGEVASAGQAAFNILSGSLLGPEFEKFITWVGAEATPVLTTFSQTFVNLASGWAGLMEDLTPAITLFDQGMVHLTQTFTNWANSPKGLAQVHAFISYVEAAWPDVQKFWGGLGHIFYEFFAAGAKGAPGMAAALGGLFTTIGNAMPNLIAFADQVLPGIVRGFAQFTGGFFSGLTSGLQQFLSAMSGAKAPNWHLIGEEAGKLTARLIEFLPVALKVGEVILNVAAALMRFRTAIAVVAGAWAAFNILQGVTALIGAIAALGGLAVIFNPISLAIIATVAAIVLVVTHLNFLGHVAASVALMFRNAVDAIARFFEQLPGRILAAIRNLPSMVGSILGQIPVLGGLMGAAGGLIGGVGGAVGGVEHMLGVGGAAAPIHHRAGNQQINVQAPMSITVQGNADQKTIDQIRALLQQHEQRLAGQLVQLRGAYG